MIAPVAGRCPFCGEVHQMGDARSPDDCRPSVSDLYFVRVMNTPKSEENMPELKSPDWWNGYHTRDREIHDRLEAELIRAFWEAVGRG